MQVLDLLEVHLLVIQEVVDSLAVPEQAILAVVVKVFLDSQEVVALLEVRVLVLQEVPLLGTLVVEDSLAVQVLVLQVVVVKEFQVIPAVEDIRAVLEQDSPAVQEILATLAVWDTLVAEEQDLQVAKEKQDL